MQDRFERFVVSITELHRYLQKLKELEMGQMDLKAGYTMCLYYLGKHPEGLTATQLTELCKEDKAAISRTLSQLSSKGLVSCELPEHKRSYRTLYYLTLWNGSPIIWSSILQSFLSSIPQRNDPSATHPDWLSNRINSKVT